MLSVRRRNPVNYSLCNQTVTVYRRDGETFSKQVYNRGFLEFKKTETVEKTGESEASSFLLVIPCDEAILAPGDKVLMGEGADVTTMEAWRDFIPAKVTGLAVVKYVDYKYFDGRICHVEAGG